MNQSEIRAQAKNAFKQQYGTSLGAYWLPSLVCMVAIIVFAIYWLDSSVSMLRYSLKNLRFIFFYLNIYLLNSVLYLPFEVGKAKVYLAIFREQKTSPGVVFSAFNSFSRIYRGMLLFSLATYLPIIIAIVLTLFSPALASLFSLIGALVSGYLNIVYGLTPYILADDPAVSPVQAVRQARRMIDGSKDELFVMQLVFFGWAILGAFTLNLLTIFYVQPWQQTAIAGFYAVLRQREETVYYGEGKLVADGIEVIDVQAVTEIEAAEETVAESRQALSADEDEMVVETAEMVDEDGERVMRAPQTPE